MIQRDRHNAVHATKNGARRNARYTRIVLLIDVLKDIAGGAERQVYELVKGISKEQFEVCLFVLHHREIPRELQGLECRVEGAGIKRIYDVRGIWEGIKFAGFLRREKIDTLMTYHFGSDIWGTIFGRLAGVPVIISNRRDVGFWRKKQHILAYKLINRWVDEIIVLSTAVKKMVTEQERVSEDKIRVIYNGVDLERFNIEVNRNLKKRQLGLNGNDFIIGCVGNLTPVKGHRYLIEAAAEVIEKYPQAHFVFLGDGPLRNSLESIVHGRQLGDKIIFLGSRNDIPDILSVMDICVLPSLSEGLSNAILEYMAAGKPIIATRVGGNPELIEDGTHGLLVESESSKQLAEAIVRLIKDKEYAQLLAEAARERIEKEFNMAKMLGEYEDVFRGKAKKRVLHLISSNGLFGAEKVLLNLSCFNNQNWTDTVVAAVRNSHNPHMELIEEAKRKNLTTVVFDSYGKIDVKMIIVIRKYIKENAIGLIHTHNYKSDILGFFASRFTKTKWIATNHVWHGSDKRLKLYEMIDAFILRFAAKVIAVSDEIKDDLIKKGIRQAKVKRIYNGINIAESCLRQPTSGLKDEFGVNGNRVITTVGRLSPEKGQAILLEAAEKIIKKRNNIKFLVVGDGPLRDSLESIARSRRLEDKVIFTGIRDDIPEIFSISDIYVNSSYIEGLPLTVLEAMGAHLPVIATRTGATPQVITNGKNGILVDCGDAQGLADQIESLISDNERRKRLAEQAYRDVCERFSLEKMGREYSGVYDEVLLAFSD